ncbi:trypsin-like peptidase domain-containing protein [Neolewinella lacunae]|uniref:Trypsin-like peptidase domain-containing protein n=1 Tax=Neolewinella lacunae TaxID=1517758 RepID=A0A923T9N6_9BACT|nr:trypsin-like peptidase domain-containing protein [Neolewinella lacunae]MBC6995724.1 trypsin-like peptidase domain-containing protein [Neolewinella lacunae]MDN3636583.1 trypsin-like peptidase domain-containing protein [Neolewinella lacunae]
MGKFPQFFTAALGGGVVAATVVLAVLYLVGLPAPAPSPFPAPAAAPVWNASSVPSYRVSYPSAESQVAPVDLRRAARLATPTVVHITAQNNNGSGRENVKALFDRENNPEFRGGEGSGVVYNAEGYIITNHHVVANTTNITVTLADRRTYPASLVGSDPKSDLAVLRIAERNLPFLELADSDAAEPGEWVLAVGSPLGLVSTVTAGIVSAKGRSISLLPDLDAIESFIQTDAAVNPGNSGGPLVTAEGKLLGINTAIASRTGRFQGYSFAIPVNLVRRIADDLITYGSYQRAFLGVEISTLTQQDLQRLQIHDRTEGVVVDAIFPGGSAARAGMQVDDVIIRIGERAIRDLPELTEIIGRARANETLKVTVVRNGKELALVVPLLAAPNGE